MEKNLLIKNDPEQNKLMNLFLLKSATEWIEKQNWISSPYGGENYLEDIIFRIKLLSGQEWNSIFQSIITKDANKELMKEYFEMLKTIDPHIRDFCDYALKNQN